MNTQSIGFIGGGRVTGFMLQAFVQKLRELAVRFGMDDDEAKRVIAAMLQGAVATLFDSGMQPGAVMDLVPVRPLADREAELVAAYEEKLSAIFDKIRP